MGFLKRLFSVGSKKNKTRGQPAEHDSNHLRRYETSQSMPLISEEAEADASRLLRSASARWAVVSEADYSPLPPLRTSQATVCHTRYSTSPSTSSEQRGYTSHWLLYIQFLFPKPWDLRGQSLPANPPFLHRIPQCQPHTPDPTPSDEICPNASRL
jgi:hypothetical protein